jgi:hypothetical protein
MTIYGDLPERVQFLAGACPSLLRKRLTGAGPRPTLTAVFFANPACFGEFVAPTIEFSRRLVVDPWPDGGMNVDVSADGVERGALARRFDLLEVGLLRGRGRLERMGKRSEFVLRGWLETDVVQSCVVTLEPVAARIPQPIERRYRLGAARSAEQARLQPHGKVDLDDDEDEVEPVSGR